MSISSAQVPRFSGCDDFRHAHWLQSTRIDTDIELSRNWFEPPVRVSVQVDRPFAHLVPSPECVMTKDKMVTFVMKFCVVLDAGPSACASGRLRIVIADDKVFAAVELTQ
jgi:hypothetical protein